MDSITEDALALLRQDGRLSYSEIARRLGTTRASIASRLAPKLESGELTIAAAVHPRMIGLEILAHLQLRVLGDSSAVAQAVLSQTNAVFVSETVGPFDIALEVHSRDLADLHRTIGVIRHIPGVVEVHFVVYEEVIASVFLDNEPAVADLELDTLDTIVVGLLQADGRVPYRDLADATGLSISSVRARVKRMVDSGVLKIAALGPRSNTAGTITFGLGLTLTPPGTDVFDIISSRKRLDFLVRTVGRFDLVATVPFDSVQAFVDFATTLRQRPDVSSVTTWLHARIWQERYQSKS
jgi:DNA-binding Lrp family transcriptional regulator